MPYAQQPPGLKDLGEIGDQYLELQREYDKKVNKLREEYAEKLKPFMDERRRRLSIDTVGTDGMGGTPAIKGFWLKAMQHHPALGEYIQKWDEPMLEHLIDIERSNLGADPSKGFKLVFVFSENPYFTGTEIWKEYHTAEAKQYSGELKVQRIIVSGIDWKVPRRSFFRHFSCCMKHGAKPKEESRPSFFRNFIRHMEHGMDLRDYGDVGKDLEALMEKDHQVGCVLRDKIIPFAVRWYTGEAWAEESPEGLQHQIAELKRENEQLRSETSELQKRLAPAVGSEVTPAVTGRLGAGQKTVGTDAAEATGVDVVVDLAAEAISEAFRSELGAKHCTLRAELQGPLTTETIAQQDLALECSAMAAARAVVLAAQEDAALEEGGALQLLEEDDQAQHQRKAQLKLLN